MGACLAFVALVSIAAGCFVRAWGFFIFSAAVLLAIFCLCLAYAMPFWQAFGLTGACLMTMQLSYVLGVFANGIWVQRHRKTGLEAASHAGQSLETDRF